MTLPEDTRPGQRFDGDHHPRQRKSDQGLSYWGGWLYRHLVPAVAIAVAALAVAKTQGKVDRAELKADQAKAAAARQSEGRGIALDFLCGGLSGVEAAGKKALRGELPGQRGQGLPDSAIAEYNATISRRVIQQARVSPKGILDERTGRIDCEALSKAAK